LTDRGPWGLKNAHTNFYASHHEPQTITQTMFDPEVTLTATPVEYRRDYGAGDTLVTAQTGYTVEIFNSESDESDQYQQTGPTAERRRHRRLGCTKKAREQMPT